MLDDTPNNTKPTSAEFSVDSFEPLPYKIE